MMSAVQELIPAIRHGYRHALRRLWQEPLASLAITLTIAIGLGATTMMLALVDSVLVEPLPFPSPGSLVALQPYRRGNATGLSLPDFLDLGEQVRGLAGLAAGNNVSTANLMAEGLEPEHVLGVRVTANFFRVLGVMPQLGHVFSDEHQLPGGPAVVVISTPTWRRLFHADPGIVGRTIQLDGNATTVLGVLPAGQELPLEADVWTPLQFSPALRTDAARGARGLRVVVGRLSFRTSPEDVQRQVDVATQALERDHPVPDVGLAISVMDLRDAVTGSVRTGLLVVTIAVGLLLVVALANVTSLYLVRSARRKVELSVRVALGARTGTLVVEQLAEATLLTILGATIGVVVGFAGLGVFRSLAPSSLPRLSDAAVNLRVVAVIAGIALLTSQLLAALPALQASRGDLTATLREGGRSGGTTPAAWRLRHAAVVAQLSLAMTVLVTATLLVRSFQALTAVDLGFRPAGVVCFELNLLGARYRSGDALAAFTSSLLVLARQLPGVRSVGLISALPLSAANQVVPYADPDAVLPPPETQPLVQMRIVSADYFSTLGVPLLEGREFTDQDAAGAPPAIIVNRAFARAAFPGQDAVGRRLMIGAGGPDAQSVRPVVGIVENTRLTRVEDAPVPTAYIPLGQAPRDGIGVLVRTDRPLEQIGPALRQLVRDLDPTLPVTAPARLEDVVAVSLVRQRLFALLLATFAAVVFVLAAGGLYSVTASAVNERRRDLAIRAALGASPRRLIGGVLWRSALLGGCGVLAGAVGAAASSRLVASLLFGVRASDTMTYLLTVAAMSALVVAASIIPARRAAATNPVLAMRGG